MTWCRLTFTRKRIHTLLLLVWALPLAYVSYRLKDSVAWVVFMSLYAIIVGHWSAIEGAVSTEKTVEVAEQIADQQE